MHSIIGLLLLILPIFFANADQFHWPEWEQFKQRMISSDGRVIDKSSSQMITTSEGQSYAMFFALVANDRATFDRLVLWTENNLAKGSFRDHHIAWLWGKNRQGQWHVLDNNTAIDANLWIAYDLLEAGRLWGDKGYIQKGYDVLNTLKKDVIKVPGIGRTLLPGKEGFEKTKGYVINPSYFPPQIMTRLASTHQTWQLVSKDAIPLLIQTAPKGYAPDWILWQPKEKKWVPPEDKTAIGSYDAIRVYLWVGMMADSKQRRELVTHFQPFVTIVEKNNYVPISVNWQTGDINGHGPVGFSAAMLPIMSEKSNIDAYLTSITNSKIENMSYYDAVLVLYGKGWYDKRYRFHKRGNLIPKWFQSNLGIED